MDAKNADSWANKSKRMKQSTLAAMGGLYGRASYSLEIGCKAPEKLTTQRSANDPCVGTHSEADEQIRFVVWLGKQGVRVVASANGGKRTLLEGAKLKRMGVAAGFPDLFIPIASGGYHGLMIEMKRANGGKVSDLQKDWIKHLTDQGYFAAVAYGFDQAKEIFLRYINLTPQAA
jgi:hypothetical protein